MASVQRSRSSKVALVMAALLLLGPAARAHNEPVHQRMTDYAYHVLVAAAAFRESGPMSERLRVMLTQLAERDPAFRELFKDAARARPKLLGLKSGLPDDATPCASAYLTGLFSGPTPNWNLPPDTPLAELPMSEVWMPITVHYGHGAASCAIDENWVPSGELSSVNPGGFLGRDHTGVILGYWAAAPDKETKDWVLRSTTLEVLQNPAVVSGLGLGATVTVSAVCALICGFFPVSCALCPAVGVGAGAAVVDEITSIDADSLESEDFVGFGHFIDMKPNAPGLSFFDEKPAKLIERAGPDGLPDATELLVTALFDLGGLHVNHSESLAPKNYEIVLGAGPIGADFHPNTVPRAPSQWEGPTAAHLQLTAVDNLGSFGYGEARSLRGTAQEAYRLGWPLHALGDASVPMHAVGASGYGHRPYEDAVDMVFDALVGSNSTGMSVETVRQVLERALVWRQLIRDWRALHDSTEVPIRDLVTAVAETTRQRSMAQPEVFKPDASLRYILDQDAAIAAYDNPAMAAFQRDLLIEGIAAELAFLISYTEVAP